MVLGLIMKYLFSVNKTINIFLILSLISIVLKTSLLNDIPELFKWGNEFGDVYTRLCLAYVSSYIFYFLVVHIKKEKDKENINSFIDPKIRSAYSQWKPQLKDICDASGVVMPEGVPEKAFIKEVFLKIAPYSSAPLILGTQGNYANWFQYFDYYKQRVDCFISVVTDKMPFLDSKLVLLLSDLSNCYHFRSLEFTLGHKTSNPNLSVWADSFHEYCLKSYALEMYAIKFHTK